MTDSPSPDLRITVEADTAQLGTLREQVGMAAKAGGADADTVNDFELVVSELATNVILHTQARQLTLVFTGTADAWILDVSNADEIIDLDQASLPSPEEIAGRGLAIVSAIMDAVVLVDVEGDQHIRCFKRRTPGNG